MFVIFSCRQSTQKTAYEVVIAVLNIILLRSYAIGYFFPKLAKRSFTLKASHNKSYVLKGTNESFEKYTRN